MSRESDRAAEGRNEQGIALVRAGKLDEAAACFEQALALAPDFAQALNNLGNVRLLTGHPEEAVTSFERVLQFAPYFPPALYNLGRALAALGRHTEAVDRFQKAIARHPAYVAACNNLGYSLRALGRREEALAAFDRALEIDPDYAFAHAGRASIMEALGRIGEARASLERAAALMPSNVTFHSALSEIKTYRAGDPQLAAMETLLPGIEGRPEATELMFALGKAYDDLEQFDRAFALFERANAARRRVVRYDEAAELDFLSRMADVYGAEALAGQGGDPSQVPVFVVGMPRSGTSLVEQILASHPLVFGAGERTDLRGAMAAERTLALHEIPQFSAEARGRIGRAYVERVQALAPQAARIVDKLPENFVWAGLIHLALPHARIIHIRRDALDTCLSCYFHSFAGRLNYTYDLGELARYYRAYDALMAHWHAVLPGSALLDVRYETLVNDLEGQTKRILAFCGLDWDARCLEFHRTERDAHTASIFQVRQPLYQSAIGRWRRYEHHLSTLREILDSVHSAA